MFSYKIKVLTINISKTTGITFLTNVQSYIFPLSIYQGYIYGPARPYIEGRTVREFVYIAVLEKNDVIDRLIATARVRFLVKRAQRENVISSK